MSLSLPLSLTVSLSLGQSLGLAGALSPTCGALQQPCRRPPVGNSALCNAKLLTAHPLVFLFNPLSSPALLHVHACCFSVWPCTAHRCVGGRATKAPRPLTASAGPPSLKAATRWWFHRPPSGHSATCCLCSATSC